MTTLPRRDMGTRADPMVCTKHRMLRVAYVILALLLLSMCAVHPVHATSPQTPPALDADTTQGASAAASKATSTASAALASVPASTPSVAFGAAGESANRKDTSLVDSSLRVGVMVVAMIVVLGFAAAALWIIGRTLFDTGTLFGLRRHWGGFGGASTGWYLSSGLVQLLLGALLVLLAWLLCMSSINAVFGLKDQKLLSDGSGASAPSPQRASGTGKARNEDK